MNRSAINTALAKAIAYKNCGKPDTAELWTIILVKRLGMSHLLAPGQADRVPADPWNQPEHTLEHAHERGEGPPRD